MTTTTPAEIDWLYYGAGKLYPGAWEEFRGGVRAGDRGGDLIAAYHQLVSNADPQVRMTAAARWCGWEDALTLEDLRSAIANMAQHLS